MDQLILIKVYMDGKMFVSKFTNITLQLYCQGPVVSIYYYTTISFKPNKSIITPKFLWCYQALNKA